MARQRYIKDLEALEEECLGGDEGLLGAVCQDTLDQVCVVGLRRLLPGEEVGKDGIEEDLMTRAIREGISFRKGRPAVEKGVAYRILRDKLGAGAFVERREHEQVLKYLVLPLGRHEVARRLDDGDDRAHAKVVVALRRELLGAELHRLHDLLREPSRIPEAKGHEPDLADHAVLSTRRLKRI